jgi:formamidopyrimidine-DNA glycosylase
MPELPEVEAFRYYVQSQCRGKTITAVLVSDKTVVKKVSVAEFKKVLVGNRFASIEREGKYLVITLATGTKKVVMHFGLTGFLAITRAPDADVRFSRMSITFAKKQILHFCDVRKFGAVYLVADEREIATLKKMGPDPSHLTQKQFLDLMQKNVRKNIKTCLMDQAVIAGIGNEYSDEILFQAGIDPRHAIGDLSPASLKKIYSQMRRVLNYAVTLRRKTVVRAGAAQKPFSAQDILFKSSYLQAHRHTDHRCPKDADHVLKKVTIGGRSAYFCPYDQK